MGIIIEVSVKDDVLILAAAKTELPFEKYGVVTFSVWEILSIPSVESKFIFEPAIGIF